MRREQLRIGEVAKLTGTTPRTIRYYEEIGLLPAAGDREPGAHRTYEEGDVERLTELLRLKDLLGVSLEELKELVTAEDARAALRREWRGGVEDPVRAARSSTRPSSHIASSSSWCGGGARRSRSWKRSCSRAGARIRALTGVCSSKCLLSIVTWPW